uniref:ZZ-type domain-containing protein n=1 Tax=Heterosigma akashiwo TaxID=2829 RepID=A0A6V1SUF4_HETAK
MNSVKVLKVAYDGEIFRTRRVPSSFESLVEFCGNCFNLPEEFKPIYRDDEDENITIRSDEDLQEALRVCEDQARTTLRVEIKSSSNPVSLGAEMQQAPKQTEEANGPCESGIAHPGIICDHCDQPIVGVRYKCAVRQDFDLCSNCEAKDKSNYPYLKICNPSQVPVALLTIMKPGQGGCISVKSLGEIEGLLVKTAMQACQGLQKKVGCSTSQKDYDRCALCMQEKEIVQYGLCAPCVLGSHHVLRYECDRCHSTQEIPHPMWMYQPSPEEFGRATWACHQGCADYTYWRIVADDVKLIPSGMAPEIWGLSSSTPANEPIEECKEVEEELSRMLELDQEEDAEENQEEEGRPPLPSNASAVPAATKPAAAAIILNASHAPAAAPDGSFDMMPPEPVQQEGGTDWAPELQQLATMGFYDLDELLPLLQKHATNIADQPLPRDATLARVLAELLG